MKQLTTSIFGLIAIVLLSACSDSDYSNYGELGWEDLKPPQEKSDDATSYSGSLEIVDDWYGDGVGQGGLGGINPGMPRQAFSSAIVAELDGTNARIPGFVVPVEFDGGNLVTEFFLVRYFGACFHKPPPPPNQTIYVTSAEPIEFESIYDPVWIMGVIKTEQTGNEMATAAYRVDLHKLAPYEG